MKHGWHRPVPNENNSIDTVLTVPQSEHSHMSCICGHATYIVITCCHIETAAIKWNVHRSSLHSATLCVSLGVAYADHYTYPGIAGE